MNRKHLSVAIVSLVAPLSFVLLRLAGITEELVLTVLTDVAAAGRSFAQVDIPLAIVALAFLGIVYGVVGACGVCDCKKEPLLLIATVTSLPAIAYLSGITLFSAGLAAFFTASLYFTQHSAVRALEKYKKIDVREIVHHATKSGALAITLFLAGFTLFAFTVNDQYSRQVVDGILGNSLGIESGDLATLDQSIQEQRRQTHYDQLEVVETALISSMRVVPSPGMSTAEKMACIAFAQSTLSQIDTLAKEDIDRQLATQSSSGSQFSLIADMLGLIQTTYPLIAAFTIWALSEFLKNIIVSPLAGVTAWLIAKKDSK